MNTPLHIEPRTRGSLLAGLAVLALSVVAGLAYAENRSTEYGAPRRVVSLNLCTDQLVLALANRDAVRSVTWLARDPNISVLATEAAQIPVNHGLAEEVIPLAPDLVVAGAYTTRTTVALLKRLGVPLLEVGMPQSVPAIYDQIRTVAHALGHPDRGEAMVAVMAAELAVLGPPPEAPRPVAVLYHPNGFTVGRGSLVDDLLARAGLRNLAAELAIDNYGRLPLEVLLLGQADLLVLNTADDVAPALAHQVLRHPSLARAFPRLRTMVVPPRLWNCAGPWVVEAIVRLRAAARRLIMAEGEQ
jgi:iron complex transport system substrate-binding protein